MRDIVLGFDTALDYTMDKVHPHFGGVPGQFISHTSQSPSMLTRCIGRYANRIKNSTFEIDGKSYNILPNEHNNEDTLHGGPDGWDWRNFTVVAQTETALTFSIYDKSGDQGFPGDGMLFTIVQYAS